MKVEVMMAWPRRSDSVVLDLTEGATVADALVAAAFTGIEGVNGYAIFGVNADASTPLREGDRVELLRPLQIDPKDARRRRASKPRR